MAEYRELQLVLDGEVGSCDCPFCDTGNIVGIKELGKYHIVASCEHINSIRYANVGESTEKAFFLRFEKTVNWENPQPKQED